MRFTFTNMETGESVKISANKDYYGKLVAGTILKNEIPFKYSTTKDFRLIKDPVFYHDNNCIVQVIPYEKSEDLEPPFFTTKNIAKIANSIGIAKTFDITVDKCSDLIRAMIRSRYIPSSTALCNSQNCNSNFKAPEPTLKVFEEMANVIICIKMLEKLLEDSGWNLDIILEQKMEKNLREIRSGEFK